MRSLFRRFMPRPPSSVSAETSQRPLSITHEPAPPCVYVVGDVHGCLPQLKALEKMIEADAGSDYDAALIVYVGDLVDRGPDSASVLDRVSFRHATGPRRIALFGNHEQMMLKFLKDPNSKSSWLAFGGIETLASYGIHSDPERGWEMSPKNWRYQIDANIPAAHLEFLAQMPCSVQVGRYFVSHSGIDARKPLAEQTMRDLLWSDPFTENPAEDITVIHGHTVVPQVEINPQRINVDTGAYATGRLSAVCLAPDKPPRVLTTSE